jgi:hypothetical protein
MKTCFQSQTRNILFHIEVQVVVCEITSQYECFCKLAHAGDLFPYGQSAVNDCFHLRGIA